MAAVELRSCPFCGGEAEDYTRQNAGATADFCGDASHWVGCTGDCGAATCMHEELADAIEAWNTRTNDQAKDEEIARYRAALEHIVSIYPEETGGMSDAALAGLLFNAANAARKALGEPS